MSQNRVTLSFKAFWQFQDMNRFTPSEILIPNLSSGRLLAPTAPLVIDENVIIGYAIGPEEAYCVNQSLNEFVSLSKSLYFQVNTPRTFHGLKRIWEFLDERALRTDADRNNYIDIDNIIDTKLLAYLLDPDSSREVDYGDYRVQEGLGLANVAQRYLGRSYPYRIIDIYDRASLDLAAEMLAYDAGLIFELAENLPFLMTGDQQMRISRVEKRQPL